MKRLFPALFLALMLPLAAVQAADEVAYVDLQEIFKQFYKTQLAQDQIRQQADDIKLEREEIEVEVNKMKDEIEILRTDSRDETFTEAERENKRDLLEEKLVELQKKETDMAEFEKLRMEQMEQQNTRMTKKLFDEIHEVIIQHAKAAGYSAVVDRSAQSRIGSEVVLYTSPKVDITADVLEILNKGRGVTKKVAPEFEVETESVE